MARRRRIAISRLAAYAADPEGFVARNGGPISAKGARYGDRYHDQFGRRSPSRFKRRLLFTAAIVALLIFVYWKLGGHPL